MTNPITEQPVTVEGQEPATTIGQQADTEPQQAQSPTPEVQDNAEKVEPDTFDRKYVEKLRKEAAANRIRAEEHEGAVAAAQAEKDDLINKIGKAFGFITDEGGEQADAQKLVEQLTSERDSSQAELRNLRQENTLSKVLGNHPVDPSLTLAVLKGTGALNDLDPTSDDYVSQVERIVSETVEAHPQLRTQAVPKSSGQKPTPTDNSDGHKLTQDDLTRLTQAGKWDEINKAVSEGRLA